MDLQVPAPPAWMRWLPALYVAAILAVEQITPVEWPVSFLLIAMPVIAAYAHGPVTVAAVTVFTVVFEGVLAGTPCCAGRSVGYLWDRHYVASYVSTAFIGVLGTILAAHRTRRRCYGCEIEPRYADVVLRRAEAEGLTVERAND